MLLLLLLIVVGAVSYAIKYFYSRIDLYLLANKLPGPTGIPIFGSGLKLLFKNSDTLNHIIELVKGFPKPTKVWLGPHLVIEFEDPVHLEKILCSTKSLEKHYVYDAMKVFLEFGLVSTSGSVWKDHRKIIQPRLHILKNSGSSVNYMKRHVATLLEKLEKHADGDIFDVHDVVRYCVADVISEIVLGMELNIQSGQNIDFLDNSFKWYYYCYSRMIRPWIHSDVIYKLTSAYKCESAAKAAVKLVIERGIEESRERTSKGENNLFSILDQLINVNPDKINDNQLIDLMLNLFLAGVDTITLNIVFLMVLLGMNPKYQKLAAEEVNSVLKDSGENASLLDLQKLKYLDMCIDEVLRLMPIGPIIIRQTTENFKIDDLVIPKGCGIAILIMNTHRHPDHWEHPEEFYPDHFLPEAVSKRHPYAFVPFSAGPRGCIAKHYSYTALRFIMVNILQRFEIEAEGTIHDIKLEADISIRSQSGYKIRLKERK